MFHFSYEVPVRGPALLDCDSPVFTPEEMRIIKNQIRKNTVLIQSCIDRLDLFVNKEKYPKHVQFVSKMRKRLYLLMEENDTFRKALWNQVRRYGASVKKEALKKPS